MLVNALPAAWVFMMVLSAIVQVGGSEGQFVKRALQPPL
jgi:hypothetical protein